MYISQKRILLAFSALLFIISLITPGSVNAAYGDTTTYVGKIYDGDGGSAVNAYFDFPEDITVDSSGNFYIADTYNNVIRKINTSNIVSTVAGTGSYGDVIGSKSVAEFALPRGVAVDGSGNVYVADTGNNKIKKISAGGSVTTLVSADLSNPEGVSVYGSTLYIADTGNNALKKVSTSGGTVTTLTSGLSSPKKMAINSSGSVIYVASSGDYKVVSVGASSGTITTIAGSGTPGYKEGVGSDAQFENIWGVALADDNTLFVSDGDGYTDLIREINLTTKTTSAFAEDTNMASINYPSGLVSYGDYIYVSNMGIGTIEKFNNISGDAERGASVTFAGKERFGNKNGSSSAALFGRPYDMVLSADRKYIYVAENNKIRKITVATGAVSHVIGSSVDNYREGTDNNPAVRFSAIQGITINSDGTALYVADRWNNRIRKVDLTASPFESSLISGAGLINTTGTDDNGYQEGTKCVGEYELDVDGCAYFKSPSGIVISPDNAYLYVTDSGNNRIRKVRISNGQTSLIAGSGVEGFADGTGASAKFNRPFGITIDSDGKNLYVADTNNHRIRKIVITTGVVSTVAGSGNAGYVDAIGTKAVFSYPEYVKWAPDGNLYVTEVGSHRIRVINTSTGVTKLVAGSGNRGFKNGDKSLAEFNNLKGVAVDLIGKRLYVADSWNDLIRSVDITGDAPFTNPAPQISASYPDVQEIAGSTSETKMILVSGSNFRHGATVAFGEHNANAAYIQSSGKIAVEIPFGNMAGGYYDISVTNTDGQVGILERGFAISVGGEIPKIEHTIDGPVPFTGDRPVVAGGGFFTHDEAYRGGFFSASADLSGDSRAEIVVGAGEGFGPQVKIFDADGNLLASFFAYATHLRSGVRVAIGDVDGNGTKEIITAPGPGGRPHIRIFNSDGTLYDTGFFALDGLFKGGAFIAGGDVNGDGKDEIVVTAGPGGGAQVTVHNAKGTILANFFAYDKNTFRYGIMPITLDFDNDGRFEILTGPVTGAPHIQMFSIQPNLVKKLNPGFYAFSPNYRGGVSLTGGDVDGDGKDEIIVGVGSGAVPIVRVFNKTATEILKEFLVYSESFQSGVNISSGDTDADGRDELLVLPRDDGGPNLRIIDAD
ncbi:MAG: FG-GAP-like repeat-containing protein [Patescibacteria group bacterium]